MMPEWLQMEMFSCLKHGTTKLTSRTHTSDTVSEGARSLETESGARGPLSSGLDPLPSGLGPLPNALGKRLIAGKFTSLIVMRFKETSIGLCFITVLGKEKSRDIEQCSLHRLKVISQCCSIVRCKSTARGSSLAWKLLPNKAQMV